VDEKDEEKVVVVAVVMRYDNSVYLRLTATDVDKYVHHPRTRQWKRPCSLGLPGKTTLTLDQLSSLQTIKREWSFA
jgi:hypothetical protein